MGRRRRRVPHTREPSAGVYGGLEAAPEAGPVGDQDNLHKRRRILSIKLRILEKHAGISWLLSGLEGKQLLVKSHRLSRHFFDREILAKPDSPSTTSSALPPEVSHDRHSSANHGFDDPAQQSLAAQSRQYGNVAVWQYPRHAFQKTYKWMLLEIFPNFCSDSQSLAKPKTQY